MKLRAPVLDRDALTAKIAGLSKASVTDLRERWKAKLGKTPSREIGRSFLARAIAYCLQERAYGGLKSSTRYLLARVAKETAIVNSPKKPQIRMTQSGTILIREWQGNAMRSARLAKRSSRARLVKDGAWLSQLMTMVGCPVGRWNDRHCRVCWLTSIRDLSMWWSSIRSTG
jgi:Protein of unknown function (DUF2924)